MSAQEEILRGFDFDQVGTGNELGCDQPTGTDIRIELASHRIVPGDAFVLDAPAIPSSLWGQVHQCLWARGEPFVLFGPDGVGKTTLAQQLALKLIGLGSPSLLGLAVCQGRRVLYLACDRPAQAARSMRRMVTSDDRMVLHEGLVFWKGPLPFDVAQNPAGLLALARREAADVIIIDSLKDVASGLSKDECGQAVNSAMQLCCAEGVEILALHHPRKAQAGAPKPNRLEDAYGSRWITAGTGSVVVLWGDPGDLIVEFTQLKQPDETVGPFKVQHDHARGLSAAIDRVEAFSLLGPEGMTAADIAERLYGKSDRNSVEKARRQLERHVQEGKAERQDGARGRGKGNKTLYFARPDPHPSLAHEITPDNTV